MDFRREPERRMISVILSTYNSPEWLRKVVWGFGAQTFRDFELVIADDGSRDDTAQLVRALRDSTGLRLKHVWQEDDGFQKSRILNKGILVADGDYLAFTDGDCIPRQDFLEIHAKQRRARRFLSGGYFKLSMDVSRAVTEDDIASQRVFDYRWLVAHGQPKTHKGLKLTASPLARRVLNAVTPTRATWNGHNASCWKTDALAVNGYDERMQYGGQDREFGERLVNSGVTGMQIRYSAIVVHLDHKRGYATKESIAKNRAIRRQTRRSGVVRTEFGLDRHDPVAVIVKN